MAVGEDTIRTAQKILKQRAVYWAPAGTDAAGATAFADPIEILCRWTDENVLFIDRQGRQAVSRATVMVDRDVALSAAMGLMPEGGKVGDYTGNPLAIAGVYEIKGFKKIADRKGTRFFREAVL
jgi:hypothetical protein